MARAVSWMADHHAQVQQEALPSNQNEEEHFRVEGTKWISFKTAASHSKSASVTFPEPVHRQYPVHGFYSGTNLL